MGRIYSIVNQKGGVGKTTTAISVGVYLASLQQKVLLIDLDSQANATSSLGIDKYSVSGGTYEALSDPGSLSENILHNPKIKLSILPSSPTMAGAEVELVNTDSRENLLKNALKTVTDQFDYILIDCPPSLGLLTLNGLLAAKNGVIIPVQCEYLALEGLGQLNTTLERIRSGLFPGLSIRGLVMTMFDSRTNLSADVVGEVRSYFDKKVFDAVIPRSVRLAEAPSYGQPISTYAPNSPGALAYLKLSNELLIGDNVSSIA